MSEFYSAYERPPQYDNKILYIVCGFVVIIAAIVLFWKYDDIVSAFEKDDNRSSNSASSKSATFYNILPSKSTTSSNMASESYIEAETSSNMASESFSQSAPSSDTASASSTNQSAPSSDTASASPSTRANTIRWNNGTRNINETCDTNEQCRSSDPYPLVCTEDQANQIKKCKKPKLDETGMMSSPCYKYQCNILLNNNIKKKFQHTSGISPTYYNGPCYKCGDRNWYYPRQHSTYGKTYSIGDGRRYPMPTYDGAPDVISSEGLYNAVCLKGGDGVCDPVYKSPT